MDARFVIVVAWISALGGCSLLLAPVESSSDGDVAADGDRDVDRERVDSGDGDPDRIFDGDDDCVPRCDGRQCGPDGCGSFCPPGCEPDIECNVEGRCECIDCERLPCGGPDGCGGFCPITCLGICCEGVCFEDGECCTDAQCGGCTGPGVRCQDLASAADCTAQGCSWSTGCQSPGYDNWCGRIHQSSRCQSCGCLWSDLFDRCFSGDIWTPINCANIEPAHCEDCGCVLEDRCTGSTSSCEDYSLQETCENQAGCSWRGCIDHRCVAEEDNIDGGPS